MTEPSPATTTAETTAETAGDVLVARSIVYSYGRTPALRGVSLNLRHGEILAVTGPHPVRASRR